MIDLNIKLCELFGIDPNKTISFDLRVRHDEFPTITLCEYVKGFTSTEQQFTLSALTIAEKPFTIDDACEAALKRLSVFIDEKAKAAGYKLKAASEFSKYEIARKLRYYG